MSAIACEYCGCTNLRWSRMRTPLRRFLKAYTRLRRYECGECFHRAWVRIPVVEPAQGDGGEAEQTGSRPLERHGGPAGQLAVVVVSALGTWVR